MCMLYALAPSNLASGHVWQMRLRRNFWLNFQIWQISGRFFQSYIANCLTAGDENVTIQLMNDETIFDMHYQLRLSLRILSL